MGFLIKKFISQFLMPTPLVFELFLFGWLLTRFSRYKQTGKCLKGLAIFLFFCFGYGIGAERYLYPLERRYPPLELKVAGSASLQGAAIVVLGQGFPEKSDLPLKYQACASFQQRLQEGMRLYRIIPDAKLFVSVAGAVDCSVKSQFIDEYAQEHDLKRTGIHLITTARDTSDEARLTMELVKTNRIVLVTSASHMPRAVKVFTKELARRGMRYTVSPGGMLPRADCDGRLSHMLIPAPCDYLYVARSGATFRLWALPLPSVDGFRMTQCALYEWLGNLYEDMTD